MPMNCYYFPQTPFHLSYAPNTCRSSNSKVISYALPATFETSPKASAKESLSTASKVISYALPATFETSPKASANEGYKLETLTPRSTHHINKIDPAHLAVDDLIKEIQEGANLSVIQNMLSMSHPAIINQIGSNHTTPLMEAARLLNKELIELLLSGGANPNIANEFGQTALMYAIRFGGASASLDQSYDPSSPSSGQFLQTKRKELAQRVRQVVILLLDYHAQVDPVDCFGSTPLQSHVNKFFFNEIDPELISLLVEAGADPSKAVRKEPHSPALAYTIKAAIQAGLQLCPEPYAQKEVWEAYPVSVEA